MNGNDVGNGNASRGLWSVIRGRSAPSLLKLIKEGADLNTVGGGDQSPLHLACELDAGECVKVLIANGADLRAEDGQLRTPLVLACESSATCAAELLMDAGAALAVTDKNDMTPLHWLARPAPSRGLPRPEAHHGCAEALALALRKGADVNAADGYMRTPLWYAISKGRLACAARLLDAGAISLLDDENRSALHLAMQHCGGLAESAASVPLLERLLQLRVDVNAVDREKRTALHWACTNNALPCVAALIAAKADVNARDWAGLAPIHCACPLDAVDSVRALLGAGAHAEATDRDNRTPLHWAADRAAEGCMKCVLEAGAKVDTTDWNGYSALHYAARRSAGGCVRLLCERGADRGLIAARGETAAELATDPEIRQTLEGPGLKRKRSLSSNTLALEQELPSLAEKVFGACQAAEPAQLEPLCAPELWAAAAADVRRLFSRKGAMALGQIHASLTACVEHKASGSDACFLLTFNQDGLVTAFKHYTQS